MSDIEISTTDDKFRVDDTPETGKRPRYNSKQMLRLTPRLVRRKLLPASYLVFLASMLVRNDLL
jgi:hypothetical protein